MSKKVIGIITHNFPSSLKDRQNAGIFVYDFTKALRKKNRIIVYCPGDSKSQKKIGQIPVQYFQFKKTKLGDLKLWNIFDLIKLIYFFISGIKNLNDFYVKNQPKIIIAMWAFPAGFFAYLLKKRFDTPYAVWALGSDIYVYSKIPLVNILIKKILKEADFLFADGIDLLNKVKKISGKKCIFLPSASYMKQSTAPKRKNNNKIVMTFLGRMEKIKGPDIIIDAIILVKSKLAGFQFNFIGDGNLLKNLKIKTKNEKIHQLINFYGNIHSANKIAKILSASDWVIIPSRSDSIPLIFSEAMKCHVPIITSDLPDLKYLVNKYQIGLVFKTENKKHLARIIEDLFQKKSLQQKFANNTKKAALDFTIEQSSKKIMNIINI